jgi:type II secretory pathway pseudopilin PulG
MKFNVMKTKKQAGFSTIELLVVMGIVMSLMIGVFFGYQQLQNSQKTQQESQNLGLLTQGIRDMFKSQPNYSTMTVAGLLNADLVPNNMISGANIVNAFAQTVTVAPATVNAIANAGFAITYNGIPKSPCTKIVTTAGYNYDIVVVGATTVKFFGNPNIDPTAVAAACAAGAGSNTIIFTGR